MVGFAGVFGEGAGSCDVETVPPTVAGGEVDCRYRERDVAFEAAFHEGTAVEQPVEAADGSLVWLWGEVYSVTDDAGVRTTVAPNESARVCAREYAEHGLGFVERLDGEFVGCVYDRDAGTVSVFLDRLGARPLYYCVAGGSLAVSTNVQTVPVVPGFEPRFDEQYLAEYLYCRRTLGTRTPIEGIRQLPPATILTCDLEGADLATAASDGGLAVDGVHGSGLEVDGVRSSGLETAGAHDSGSATGSVGTGAGGSGGSPLGGVDATPVDAGPELSRDGFELVRYWTPRYRPVDRPLSYFTRELAERFERAVADRTSDDRDHGLLLSGGSDSRAVLAAADEPLTGFHLGDGWNREARIAKRAADAAGAAFELLERGADYHATLLERAAPIQEFVGPFHTGHALGFAEEIADEVDVLHTGLYSDDLFGSWSVPQATLRLPLDVQFWLPVERLPATTAAFVDGQVASGPTRQPSFLDSTPLEAILSQNVETLAGQSRSGRRSNAAVDFHGVEYDSVEQLALSSTLYPITNGIGFDLYSALQIAPTRNPFLDRRLLDLHCSMPLRYRLRHDPLHEAIDRLDSSLASIPHAASQLPVRYPKAAHVLGKRATNQLDKLRRAGSYQTDGPWQDKNEVVRATEFVGEAIDENEAVLRRLPGVDVEAVRETYRRHCDGETDAAEELYRLLSVVEMPLTQRVVGE